MAEILTESFCERCGTRYTFETTAPRRRGLGRIGTLSRGVKNFVSNDDASFAEAMAAAREEDARSASLQQLDAFHRTFTFCMSCRQYTCGNCWNSAAGECLSCAPDLSREILPAPFPDLAVLRPEADATTLPEPDLPNPTASAWPPSDRRADLEAAAFVGPQPAEPADAIATGPVAAELAPLTAAPADVELTPDELAAVQGALTRVDRLIPGPTGAPTIGVGQPAFEAAEIPTPAVEAAPVAALSSVTLEPVVNPESVVSPEPVVGPGPLVGPESVIRPHVETRRFMARFRPRPHPPAPVVVAEAPAAPEPVVEPVAAEAPWEPPATAPPSPPTDIVVQPTWRMVAPDGAAPDAPQPVPPAWATPGPVTRRAADAMPAATWAARVATARPLESPVWAASSRDVLAVGGRGAAGPVGIQSCVSCGLSLSANARFCRRCGARQG